MDSILLTMAGVKIPNNHNDNNKEVTTTVTEPQLSTITEKMQPSQFKTTTDIDIYWYDKMVEFNTTVQDTKAIPTTANISIQDQLNI